MNAPYTVLAIGLASLLTGAVLVVRGLLSKRVGGAPHCRKCGYNLTGRVSAVCPECGAVLTSRSIVYGVRRRRVAQLVLGAFLLVVSGILIGVLAYARAKQVDWYPYAPFAWVLADARRNVNPALTEVQRRYIAGELSSAQALQLSEAILEEMEQRQRPQNLEVWVAMMRLLDEGGHFGLPQKDRFARRLLAFSLDVQRAVRQGDSFVVTLRAHVAAPISWPVVVRHRHGTVRIGERLVVDNMAVSKDMAPPRPMSPPTRDDYGESQDDVWHSVVIGSVDLAPGWYQLEFAVQQELFWKGFSGEDLGEPFWSKQLTYREELEVLAAEASAPAR
ncbi:MAG: TFIIB-type zinc ribbon-containing protein [Phycisphaerales bacterium]|nr:MAG: TFIIB-type zinc ribbon-containing protein [Phycisphaerales bacterium]